MIPPAAQEQVSRWVKVVPRPPILQRIPLGEHTVIEASAGTGKTYTLEHLIVDFIVNADARLDEILVVTFTEKATLEMRSRVRDTLGRILNTPDAPATLDTAEEASETRGDEEEGGGVWRIDRAALARLRDAYESFDASPIYTIHGFCQRVLRDHAFETGGLFELQLAAARTVFGASARAVLREALRATDPAAPLLRAALSGSTLEQIEDVLFAWSQERGELMPAFDADTLGALLARVPANATRVCAEAEALRAGTRETVQALVRDLQRVIDECRGDDTSETGGEETGGVLLPLFGGRADSAADESTPGHPLRMLDRLTALHAWRSQKQAGKPRPRWLLERSNKHDGLRDALQPYLDLFEGLPSPRMVLVQQLVPRVAARVEADKQRDGVLDFDDLLLRVRRALVGDSGRALVESLRSRYRFALVDEFQDTDEVQWEIFRRLFAPQESRGDLPPAPRHDDGERRALYVIGDPKQAIYGFRNADLHTYESARTHLAEERPIVRLDRCYRSSAELIAAYNHVLGSGFFAGRIDYDHPVSHGGAQRALRPSPAGPEGADVSVSALAPIVLLQPFGHTKLKTRKLLAAQADYIAEEIAMLTRGGYEVHEWEASPDSAAASGADVEVRRRTLSPSDVHVLTRSASEAALVAAALRRRGVPFAQFKQEGLFQTREAEDVLAVLRAIADPTRRAARFAAWTTRFFGVPLGRLADYRDVDEQHPLVARLREWQSMAQAHDFGSLMRSMLDDSGLRRRELLQRPDGRALTNYQHILEVVLEQGHGQRRGVWELAAALESYIAGAALPAGDGGGVQRLPSDKPAVQLLTMHKAKGLEADVVFVLGGLGRRPSAGEAPQVRHVEGQREAWMKPLPAGVEQDVRRELDAEDERLLYVAMTRARVRLYLLHVGSAPSSAHASTSVALPEGAFTDIRVSGSYRLLADALERAAQTEPWHFEHRYFEVPEGLRPSGTPAELTAGPVVDDAVVRRCLETLERVPAEQDFAHARRERAGFVFTSYSRMKAERGGYEPPPAPEDGASEEFTAERDGLGVVATTEVASLPGGASVGVFLHEVIENLDWQRVGELLTDSELARDDENDPHDEEQSGEALLADAACLREFESAAARNGVDAKHLPAAAVLVQRALGRPVRFGPHSLTRFCDLDAPLCEMSFQYPVPERFHPELGAARGPSQRRPFAISRGVVRGVVDVVFEHDGRVFFLDWKSDRLPDANPDRLRAHVQANYSLQAKLYTLGVLRLLNVREEPDYARFGGLLYSFLRVLGDGELGTVFDRPTWGQVCDWEREFRVADEPFGYRVVPSGGSAP